jgi:hypothetical protein
VSEKQKAEGRVVISSGEYINKTKQDKTATVEVHAWGSIQYIPGARPKAS